MLLVGSVGTAASGCTSFVGAATSDTEGDDGSSSSSETSAASLTTAPSSDAASDTAMSDSDSASSTATTTTNGTTDPTRGTGPSGSGPTTDTASTDPSDSDADSGDTGIAETESTGAEDGGTDSSGASDSDPTTDSDSDSDTGACVEQDEEPNGLDAKGEFQELGDQFCDDAPSSVDGTIFDENDLDVFRYVGVWDCGNVNNPNHVVEVTGGVDACLFPACEGTGTETVCIEGSVVTTEGGLVGCCSTNLIVADVNCTFNADETASGFMSVSPPAPDACFDYTLTYSVEDA